MLRLYGSGLKDFVAEKPRGDLLMRGERRVWVRWEGQWTEGVPEGTHGERSVIISADGVQRWEVPRYSGPRPMLCFNLDQGSQGYSAMWYMFSELRVTGGWLDDPFHRAYNDWKDSVQQCGWWGIVLEYLIVANLPRGPWQSEAFFQKLVEGADMYLKSADAHDPLFRLMYPAICSDTIEASAIDFGTDQGTKRIFGQVRTAECLKSKGPKVALKTWFGWNQAVRELEKQHHTLLLYLCALGVRGGWFKSAATMPIFGHGGAYMDKEVAKVAASSSSASSAAPGGHGVSASSSSAAAPAAAASATTTVQ